jgi:hypothetical protein
MPPRTPDDAYTVRAANSRMLKSKQFFEALGKHHPKSKSRGREGTPAGTVMRLMTLKHIRNWSYVTLEREVCSNLVYRNFTRVGAGKMPDAKTMGRWGSASGTDQAIPRENGENRSSQQCRGRASYEGRYDGD